MKERPRGKKRFPGRKRYWLLGFLLPLGFVLFVSPFLLVRVEPIRDWLLDRSLRGSVLAEGQRLRIGEVKRFGPGGVRFSRIGLETPRDGGWARWLEITDFRASWRPLDLLAGHISLSDLRVDSVLVDCDEIPTPIFVSGREKTTPGPPRPSLPELECDAFEIGDVRLDRNGGEWLRGSLRLRGLEHRNSQVEVRLDRGTVVSVTDSLELALSGARIHGRLLERLAVDSLEIEGSGLEARLQAVWNEAPSGSTGAETVEGRLDPLEFAPTSLRWLRKPWLPWEAGDRLSGSLRFQAERPPEGKSRADLVLQATGTLLGTPVDSLDLLVEATPDLAEINGLDLRFGPLAVTGEGRWRPGRGSASGKLEFEGLDLSGRPVSRFAAKLPATRLAGSAEVQAESLGTGNRIRSNLQLYPGTIADRPLGGFWAELDVDRGTVALDTLWTGERTRPTLTARGCLDRRSKRLEVSGDLHRFPLESWVEPWVGQGLAGAVSGPFTLRGPLDRVEMSADLGVRHGRVVEIRVDTLRAGPARGTFQPLRIETPVDAQGLAIYGIGLDSLRATTSIADTIAVDAMAQRDTTRIRVRGGVRPVRDGSVQLDELRIEPGSAAAVDLEEPATLFFSPERVWVDTVAVRSAAGRAAGSGWIRPEPGPAADDPFAFRLTGNNLDVGAVAGFFGLDADTLNGTADAWLSGEGTRDAPRYRFSVRARTAETYGWLWESVRVDGSAGAVGPPLTAVAPDPAPRGSRSNGTLDDDSPGIGSAAPSGSVRIDSLHAVARGFAGPLPAVGPETMGPMPPGPPVLLEAEDLQIGFPESWAQAVGAASDSLFPLLGSARISGAVQVDHVPAAPLLAPILAPRARRGAQATFAPEPVDPMLAVIRVERPGSEQLAQLRPTAMGGRISARVELGGTGAEPEIRVRGRARDLQVYQAYADSVGLEAWYVDSLLYVQRLDWNRQERGIRISGRVPLRLTTDPSQLRLLERPLWIEAEIPSADLSLATLATTLIEDPSGDLSGRMRVKGVPPDLHVEGNLEVTNGAFRIPQREERVSDVRASLHLDSLGVHIDQARGRWNETGRVEASGWYRDRNRFALQGKVRNATVFETGNYRFEGDGEFQAAPVASGDSLRPRLTGDVRINKGLITMDLAKQRRGKVLETPWLIDLTVEAPGNITVSQPSSYVELGGGQLEVRYDMPYWNLSGQLDIQSGRYQVFNKSFEITHGTVEFLDTSTGPYPVLDVSARTELADPEGSGMIEIDISVQGSPLPGEGLDVTLSSPNRPEYHQDELIELLSVGQLTSGEFATGTSRDPARGFLTGQVVNQLERALLAQGIIPSRVAVSGGTDQTDPWVLTVRAITEPQWTVSYSREISADPGQEVAVDYRVSNLFFLNAAVDRRRSDLGYSTETYSLDFKARYEY